MARRNFTSRGAAFGRQQKLPLDIRTSLRLNPGIHSQRLRAENRALRRIGGGIKSLARKLHRRRKRKTPSAAGEIPIERTGVIRRFINWSVTTSGAPSVVIGADRVSGKKPEVLKALAKGGTVSVKWRERRGVVWVDRQKRIHLRARPGMLRTIENPQAGRIITSIMDDMWRKVFPERR